MSDGEALLRAVIASPDDSLPRLVYSDWLEEQGDDRAELLRSDWDVSRLSFVDRLAESGVLSEYFRTHPELSGRLGERAANERWRESLRRLTGAIDENWVTVIDTLGRPFRPFFFWNDTGPRSFEDGELPFREAIGSRGPVVTFESAFRGDAAWQPGLAEDLGFLHRLRLGEVECGAASCPMHPFACELSHASGPLTGGQVLEALRVSEFRSEHIGRLDVAAIPYPGYHAYTDNDEIHTDPSGQ